MPHARLRWQVAVVDSPNVFIRGEQRLMTRIPLSLAVRFFVAAAALSFPALIQAQGPGGSSAREIPTEVQRSDPRVDQIIERANDHFRRGKLNLEDNKREQGQRHSHDRLGHDRAPDHRNVVWRAQKLCPMLT